MKRPHPYVKRKSACADAPIGHIFMCDDLRSATSTQDCLRDMMRKASVRCAVKGDPSEGYKVTVLS